MTQAELESLIRRLQTATAYALAKAGLMTAGDALTQIGRGRARETTVIGSRAIGIARDRGRESTNLASDDMNQWRGRGRS